MNSIYHFYHIGISFPLGTRTNAIDYVLNNIINDDWVRYSANTWIVWSQKSAHDIYLMLSPHLNQTEQVLVFPIDANNRYGFASQWIWQWIDSKRTSPHKSLGDILADAANQQRLAGEGDG